MSSVYIISAIVALLTLLVCYVFISQHLEKKRKQRQRLLHALKQRLRLFKFMASSFPDGLLSPELSALMYRVLLSTCEQLAGLDPKGGFSEELEQYKLQSEAHKKAPAKKPTLKGPQQVKEVRGLLQELQRFITAQAEFGRMPKAQAASYLPHIRQTMLKVTLDGYVEQARQAQRDKKDRLALHYYTLARKLLLKEAGQQDVQRQITQLSATISQLQSKLEQHSAPPASEVEEQEQVQKAWEHFEEEDDWKKKQLYD